jgi:hypothetical protein
MKRPNRTILISSMLVFLLIGVIVGYNISNPSKEQVQAQPPLALTQERQAKLKALGLDFTPVDETSVASNQAQVFIPRQRAIDTARQGLSNTGVRIISVALGNLSDAQMKGAQAAGIPVDPARVDMGLVWIVTFDGIESISSGPPEAPRKVAHEYNVVIDARTGKHVMAFPS